MGPNVDGFKIAYSLGTFYCKLRLKRCCSESYLHCLDYLSSAAGSALTATVVTRLTIAAIPIVST